MPAPEALPAQRKSVRYHRAGGMAVAISELPLPDGITKPYRPLPTDFRAVFLELGWSKEIEEYYRTNWRVIRRWIELAGGEDLRAARRAVTGATPRHKLRAEWRRRA